jgi:hypothetical protein
VGVDSANVGNIEFAEVVLEKAILAENELIKQGGGRYHSVDFCYWGIAVAFARKGDIQNTQQQIEHIKSIPWKIDALVASALEFASKHNFMATRIFMHRAYSLLSLPNRRLFGEFERDEVCALLARARQRLALAKVCRTIQPNSNYLFGRESIRLAIGSKRYKNLHNYKRYTDRHIVSSRIRIRRKQWFKMGVSSLIVIENIRDDLDRIKVFYEMIDMCAKAGDLIMPQRFIVPLQEMVEEIKEEESSYYIESSCILAACLAKMGNKQQAKEMFSSIKDVVTKNKGVQIYGSNTNDHLGDIAIWEAEAGLGENAIETFSKVFDGRWKYIEQVAEALLKTGDKNNFKRVIKLAGYEYDITIKMCSLLAGCYPSEAAPIADIILRYTKSASLILEN